MALFLLDTKEAPQNQTQILKKKCKKLAFKTVYQRMVKLISSNNFKNTNFHHNAINFFKKKKKKNTNFQQHRFIYSVFRITIFFSKYENIKA